MSKESADIKDLVSPEETSANQTNSDLFNSFLNAPVTKLDADEYTANDLDGVTEGLLGSGNMNFLMMQAGQTNEAILNHNPFGISPSSQLSGNLSPISLSGGQGFLPTSDSDMDSDRAGYMPDALGGDSVLSPLNTTNSSVGTLGASTLAVNTDSSNPLAGTYYSSSTATSLPPGNGTNGNSGLNGVSGTSGTNGIDGQDGTGTTIINNTTIIDDSILENIENFYDDTTTLLQTIIENVGDIYNTTITSTTNIVNNLVNNIFGGTLGPVGISLDATINDVTNLTLDIINGTTITNVLNETLNTAPILVPVQNLIGDLFSNTSLDVLLNPFQFDNSPNDVDFHIGTDLDVLGLTLPDLSIDVPLDIVEGLTGDLDISLDLTNALLNSIPLLSGNEDTDLGLNGLESIADLSMVENAVEGLFNPVEDLVGDVDILADIGVDLLGLGADGDTGADTDITLPLDLDLADGDLLNDTLEISLDPIENIVGDIDIDLTVAGNLLGDTADALVDNVMGGAGDDGLVSDIGDTLGDLGGNLLPIGDNNDTDISLDLGVDALDTNLVDNPLDIVLDPVEDVVGDIDLGGDIGLDLLGTADGGVDDTDLFVPLDIALLDNPLVDQDIDVSLDPVEALVGDIDLSVPLGVDLLGEAAGNVVDSEDGGSGTDNLLADVGDLLTDTGEAILGGEDVEQIFDIIMQDADGVVTDLSDINPLDDLASDLDENGLDLLGDAFGLLDETVDTAVDLIDSALPSSGSLDLGSVTETLDGGDLGDTAGTWTENILPDAGSILGDGLGDITDPILADPVIDITPIIPAPIGGSGGGGGLLGGFGGGSSSGGGLFG